MCSAIRSAACILAPSVEANPERSRISIGAVQNVAADDRASNCGVSTHAGELREACDADHLGYLRDAVFSAPGSFRCAARTILNARTWSEQDGRAPPRVLQGRRGDVLPGLMRQLEAHRAA